VRRPQARERAIEQSTCLEPAEDGIALLVIDDDPFPMGISSAYGSTTAFPETRISNSDGGSYSEGQVAGTIVYGDLLSARRWR
jgi:hypothetical protein